VAFNTRTKNTLCCTQQARDRDEPDFDEQNWSDDDIKN
jgi:hypothetical protein